MNHNLKGCARMFSFCGMIPAFMLLACRPDNHILSRSEQQLAIDTTRLRHGDLLFRMGREGASRVVTALSGGDFSHVGLAVKSDSGWMVLHAVPNEAPYGEPDRIKYESLSDFFSVGRASRGAQRRVHCSDKVSGRVVRRAMEKYHEGVCFDHNYDLTDSTAFYCTEFIWFLFLKEGIDLAEERRHELAIPGSTNSFLFPEDIWNSRWLDTCQIK